MAISNSQLATRVETLLQSWSRRERQYADWLAGAATGGPNGDGRYPLTDGLGTTRLVDCPARLADGLAGPAALAQAALAASEVLRDQSVSEATRSAAQAVLSGAHRAAAETARDRAVTAEEAARNHEANARVFRDAAELARQGTAADLLGTTALHEDTTYQAALAENAARDAQAAAERAGNYDPSLYATRADGLTQIAGLQAALAERALLSGSRFTGSTLVGHNHSSGETTLGGAGIEMRWASGPYIDLSKDAGSDFHARLQLNVNDNYLDVTAGGLRVNGARVMLNGHGGNLEWLDLGSSRIYPEGYDLVVRSGAPGADRWSVFRASGDLDVLVGTVKVQGNPVWHRGNLTALDLNTGGEVKGYSAFRPLFNASVAAANARGLEVHGEWGTNGVSGAALMTFHRPGSFALYFGLDVDNELKFGGWSEGANAYRLWTAKNFNPASKMDRFTNDWVRTADNKERFYFAANGTTYVRGHNGVEFRNANDQWVLRAQEDGNVVAMGNFYAGSNQWFRTTGTGGLVFDTYGGGWHMTDTSWIRAYNNKHIHTGGQLYTGGEIRTDTHFKVGDVRQPVIRSGTAAPSGGVDGDLYVQF